MEENRKIVFLGYSQSGKTKIVAGKFHPPHPPPPLILPRGVGGGEISLQQLMRVVFSKD